MVSAAVLRAEQIIDSGLSGLEPQRTVTARQHVLLDAEGGHKEAVDYVFGDHGQLDGAAHRHVKIADLRLAGRMLEFPHPLLAYDENFEGVSRRIDNIKIARRGPGE